MQIEEAYDSYRFDLASQALYDFIWNEFCDWYLELSKPILWDDTAKTVTAASCAADSSHGAGTIAQNATSLYAFSYRGDMANGRAACRQARGEHHARALAGAMPRSG